MSERCPRCQSAIEAEDLRCPVCVLPVIHQEDTRTEALAAVLRCDECGAAVTYQVEVRAPRCAFCGATAHVETPEDPVEQAERFVPFDVSIEQARSALQGWLGGLGWFRPADLRSSATLEALTPLYWIAWSIDVNTRVSWTADSNVGARRGDWAPHAGQLDVATRELLVSASRGLSAAETEQLALEQKLERTSDAPSELPGLVVERFDLQRSAARRIVDRAAMRAAEVAVGPYLPGHRQRNLNIATLTTGLETTRVALPAHVLAYRYKDRVYRAVVDGQDATHVIGSAPISWPKVLAAAAAVALIILLILLAGPQP